MHQFFSASRICINSIARSCIIFASIFNLLSLRLYFSCFLNVKCNSFLSFAIYCVPQYALISSRYCSLPPLLAFKYSVLPLYKKTRICSNTTLLRKHSCSTHCLLPTIIHCICFLFTNRWFKDRIFTILFANIIHCPVVDCKCCQSSSTKCSRF